MRRTRRDSDNLRQSRCRCFRAPRRLCGPYDPISSAGDHLSVYCRKWLSAPLQMRASEKTFMLDPASVDTFFADLQPPIVARSKTNPPQGLSCAASILRPVRRLLRPARAPQRRARVRQGAGGVAGPRKGNRGCTAICSHDGRSVPRSADAGGDRRRQAAGPGDRGRRHGGRRAPAALSALESDYRVQVPVDACGGLSARTEDAALRQIEAAGGVTTSVVSLVTAMAPDFAQEPGRNTFAALQVLRLA